jgi:hypothetical protein
MRLKYRKGLDGKSLEAHVIALFGSTEAHLAVLFLFFRPAAIGSIWPGLSPLLALTIAVVLLLLAALVLFAALLLAEFVLVLGNDEACRS